MISARTAWRSLAGGLALVAVSALLVMRTGAQEAEVRLAFIGDGGTGDANQAAVRDQILRFLPRYLFLLGDNIYSDGRGAYIRSRFDDVYRPLLLRGVVIHSALGNHDVQECLGAEAEPLPVNADAYRWRERRCDVEEHLGHGPFGYQDRRRYYSVVSDPGPSPLVEVFVLDSNTLAGTQSKTPLRPDRAQVEWLDRALGASRARWKLLAMHHPPHSPVAKNGFLGFGDGRVPEVALKNQLQPILARHPVDAVLAAHNHFYARMFPQAGVGGWMPRPRKDRNDSRMITRATCSVAMTTIADIRLGRIWRKMIRRWLIPRARPAVMNSRSRIDSVSARITRA